MSPGVFDPNALSVSGSIADLQLLVTTLPLVEAGHVIRPDDHNNLVQTVQLMAHLMGVGPVASDLTLSVAPIFLPITESGTTLPAWDIGKGVANRSSAVSAEGWIPVNLPSGARIKQMVVRGNRSGAVGSCWVRLERQSIASGEPATIAQVNLKSVETSPFEQVVDPAPGGTVELRTVDNTKYSYFISAELSNATSGAVVELFPLQIVYGLEG
jgi:hypothetical protein